MTTPGRRLDGQNVARLAMAITGTETSGGLRQGGALVVAAMLLVATGIWFAASWIDTGYDSTCGAVVHPDVWLDESAPRSCRDVMAVRSTISAVVLVAGATLHYSAVRRAPITRTRAAMVVVIAATVSVGLLIINEAVRSHGAI